MRSLHKLLFALLLGCSLYSCETVKPYQTQYLKDYHMQTGAQSIEKLEAESETYREGASGGMGGKTGGGCGCN